MIRPCNICQTRNCRGSKEAEMREPCKLYTPIKRSMGALLEELIETSPVALSQLLLDMRLEIHNHPEPPYFQIRGQR
jgi:hypothetical protein